MLEAELHQTEPWMIWEFNIWEIGLLSGIRIPQCTSGIGRCSSQSTISIENLRWTEGRRLGWKWRRGRGQSWRRAVRWIREVDFGDWLKSSVICRHRRQLILIYLVPRRTGVYDLWSSLSTFQTRWGLVITSGQSTLAWSLRFRISSDFS